MKHFIVNSLFHNYYPKNMKISSHLRKLLVLFIVSSLSLTVMNCSKSNDDSPSAQIIGTWKISNLYVKEGTKAEIDQLPLLATFLPCIKDISFTFKSNGELTGSIPDACKSEVEDYVGIAATSKYEVKDEKLTITDTDGSQTIVDLSFSGKSQMTWSTSETTAGTTTTTRFVFAKQ